MTRSPLARMSSGNIKRVRPSQTTSTILSPSTFDATITAPVGTVNAIRRSSSTIRANVGDMSRKVFKNIISGADQVNVYCLLSSQNRLCPESLSVHTVTQNTVQAVFRSEKDVISRCKGSDGRPTATIAQRKCQQYFLWFNGARPAQRSIQDSRRCAGCLQERRAREHSLDVRDSLLS